LFSFIPAIKHTASPSEEAVGQYLGKQVPFIMINEHEHINTP